MVWCGVVWVGGWVGGWMCDVDKFVEWTNLLNQGMQCNFIADLAQTAYWDDLQ